MLGRNYKEQLAGEEVKYKSDGQRVSRITAGLGRGEVCGSHGDERCVPFIGQVLVVGGHGKGAGQGISHFVFYTLN